MLTIKEASEFLGGPIPTMRRWESEGKITSYRTTGKYRRNNNSRGLSYDICKKDRNNI